MLENLQQDYEGALRAYERYQRVADLNRSETTFEDVLDELFFVEVNLARLRRRIEESQTPAGADADRSP